MIFKRGGNKQGERGSFLIGVLHILFAWLCLTIAVTFTRFAISESNLSMVLFFLNLICFILILPWFVVYGKRSVKTNEWRMILVRTVFGVLGFAFVFLAVQKISLVEAILLNNSAPIFIPVIIWLWLRKTIDHKLWPGILLGFMGVILILKPGPEVIAGALRLEGGTLLALAAGLCLAIAMISMRLLLRTEKLFTVLFYYYFIGTLLTFPFAMRNWIPPTQEALWLFLGIGVLAFIGQFAFLRAFRYGKASQLSPYVYSSVIYAGLIDWIFFHQLPHFYFLLGIILIMMGGIWNIVFSKPKVG